MAPVLIPYGGFTDGFTSANEVADGLDGGSATQLMALPFTTTYHLFKHLCYGVIHALDFVAFPIYGAAELHPYGPEVEPLDFYTGTWFDENGQSGTDPQTGEDR